MPRLRFSIRRLITIILLLAIGFGSLRFVIREYSAFVPQRQGGMLDETPETIASDARKQRIGKVVELTVTPVLLIVCGLAIVVAFRYQLRICRSAFPE
jgi:hypothetical protein